MARDVGTAVDVNCAAPYALAGGDDDLPIVHRFLATGQGTGGTR